MHGVTGIIGSLGIGLFATKQVNPNGPDGLFYGNPAQLGIQAVGVAAAVAWSAVGTFALLLILRGTLGLRHPADALRAETIDYLDHGEAAYSADLPPPRKDE